VGAEDWDVERIPEHLRLCCKVVDENGSVLGAGRDLQELKGKLSGEATPAQTDFSEYERRGIQEFPESLRDHVVLQTGSGPTMGFPGLRYVAPTQTNQGGKGGVKSRVDVAIFPTVTEREASNRQGYAQLALQSLGKPAQFFRRELGKQKQLGLYFASMGNADALAEQLMLSVAWYCYFDGQILPTTRQEFDARMTARRGALAEVFQLTLSSFEAVLKLRFDIIRELEHLQSPGLAPSVEDLQAQLAHLVPKDVLLITPWRYLPSLPYYLQGLRYRLAQLRGHVPKDRSLMQQVAPLQQRLEAIKSAELHNPVNDAELHFFLQELRLKLFAEPIAQQKRPQPAFSGTGWKVSLKRVDEKIRVEEQRVGLA
jgi:ATP-dependent helicase HrpA